MRWPHPTRGMVPPLAFIQIAEESRPDRAAGRLGAAHRGRGRRRVAADQTRSTPPYVSVNVSVRQFRSPGFVDQVLRRAGPFRTCRRSCSRSRSPRACCSATTSRSRPTSPGCAQAGIKVSIDDFGTGYSSLSYLHRVPVDTLKLDKSFVDTISTSEQQLDLVRGIIQLADTLAARRRGRGHRDADEHHLLTDAGCAFGQGYLFARPDDRRGRAPAHRGRGAADWS